MNKWGMLSESLKPCLEMLAIHIHEATYTRCTKEDDNGNK